MGAKSRETLVFNKSDRYQPLTCIYVTVVMGSGLERDVPEPAVSRVGCHVYFISVLYREPRDNRLMDDLEQFVDLENAIFKERVDPDFNITYVMLHCHANFTIYKVRLYNHIHIYEGRTKSTRNGGVGEGQHGMRLCSHSLTTCVAYDGRLSTNVRRLSVLI